MKKTKFIYIGIICLVSLLNLCVKQNSDNSDCLQSLVKTALADGEASGVNCDSYIPCPSAGGDNYYNTQFDSTSGDKTCCANVEEDRGCEEGPTHV